MREFKKVITEIYKEKGVRSLLLIANMFGNMEEVEFNHTSKKNITTKGIGKHTVEITERKYIDGAKAKQMCHDYVIKKIERSLLGENVNPVVKFDDLIKSLGL